LSRRQAVAILPLLLFTFDRMQNAFRYLLLGFTASLTGPSPAQAGVALHGNPDQHSSKLNVGYMHALSLRANIYTDLYHESGNDRGAGAALGISHSL
jgi:hypothetical protein